MGSMITSFSKLGVSLLDTLPELSKGATKVAKRVSLSGADSDTVRKLLPNAKAPFADIGYTVRDGYSIMGIRLRDGQKVLDKGVFSVTSDGKVVKYKMRLGENGSNLTTNGFYDRNARFDTKHWKFSGERDDKIFETVARSNGKFANYTTVNQDFLSEFFHNMKSLGGKYTGLLESGVKRLT